MAQKNDSQEPKDVVALHAVYRGAVNMSLHHTHNAYEITCVLAGRRMLYIHGRQYVLDPNHVVIIPEGIPHKTVSCDNNLQESVSIQYTADFLERLLGEHAQELVDMLSNMAMVLELSEPSRQVVEKQVRALVAVSNEQSGMKELRLKTAFLNVLLTLYQEVEELYKNTSAAERQAMTKSDTVFQEIIAYLDANYRQRVTLEAMSEKFHLSKSRLSLKLNQYLGMSWVSYINFLRIQDAQKMLETSYSNISEVAASVGFDSLTHFERVFKKIIGKTPTEYIREKKAAHFAAPQSAEEQYRLSLQRAAKKDRKA